MQTSYDTQMNLWTRVLYELQVIKSVFIKQWLHTIRYPSWVIQLIIWPLIFPAAYILTARAFAGPNLMALPVFNQASGTQNYIGFIVVGTMVWMWQNIVLWNVGYSLRDEQLRGTLESNWLSPSWRFSLILGSIFEQMITIVLFFTITYLEYHFVFNVQFEGKIGLTILAFLAGVPSIYGIGITFASLVIRVKEADSFVKLVRGIVMIFCGISYPLSILPDWMASISKWLPQTYIVRSVRNAALIETSFDLIKNDLLILLVFGLFWMVVGYFTFIWMEQQSRKSGVIGQY